MIYLAVLLILSGLLIVIAALFIERADISYMTEKQTDEEVRDDYDHLIYNEPDEMEIIFPDEQVVMPEKYHEHADDDIFISFDDDFDAATESNALSANDDWGIEQDEDFDIKVERKIAYKKEYPAEKTETVPDRDDSIKSVQAIMYDDKSNIIDYESGDSMIDSTFAKYKSIKRIGKGKLEADSDGLNFFLGEKLYRFDFHKVYDIWSGDNYIALPLKGSSNVKLFLIENPRDFPEKVEVYFKEYEKGL